MSLPSRPINALPEPAKFTVISTVYLLFSFNSRLVDIPPNGSQALVVALLVKESQSSSLVTFVAVAAISLTSSPSTFSSTEVLNKTSFFISRVPSSHSSTSVVAATVEKGTTASIIITESIADKILIVFFIIKNLHFHHNSRKCVRHHQCRLPLPTMT